MDPSTPVLVSGGYDSSLLFWSAHCGDSYKSIPHTDTHINAIAVSPDYTTLAVAGNPTLRFYDVHIASVDRPQPIVSFQGHSTNITSVGFECWGRWFYSGSEDGTVKVWDCRTSKGYQLYHDNNSTPVHDVCVHPNQGVLIFADQKGQVQLWDLKANRIRDRLVPECGTPVRSVAVSPDGSTLAAATHSGRLHLWHLSGRSVLEELKSIDAHNGNYVLKCRFSPHSELLATTSSDSTCTIWRHHTDGFSKEVTLVGHKRWVWDCVFSSDSAYVVTGSSDCTCRLWDVNTGHNVLVYQGHQMAVTSIVLLDFPHDPEAEAASRGFYSSF
eukprot:GHVS01011980.1.p1 GENE.GHVS01011980.1~~GHVS01011980.1.p1  ORF type:complete len:328 (+),score=18.45 GHVS01011980.1:157-1140(+)